MMAFVKSLNSGLKPVIVNLTNRFRVAVRLSLRVSPWGGGGEATRRLRASIQ